MTPSQPLTFSLQISFIFLGRRDLSPDHNRRLDSPTKRLEAAHGALSQVCADVAIKLLRPRHSSETAEDGRKEQEKVRTQGKGVWFLGLLPKSANGIGVLTAEERSTLGSRVWAMSMLLSKAGVGVYESDGVVLREEVEKLVRGFDRLNAFRFSADSADAAGAGGQHMFRIVASLRCWTRVIFYPPQHLDPSSSPPFFTKPCITNLLLLLTALEQPLTLLDSPSHLLLFRPLSDVLTQFLVKCMARERKARRDALVVKGREGCGEKRWLKRWGVEEWVMRMGWEDEERAGLERLLGRGRGLGWWEVLDEDEGDVDGVDLKEVVRELGRARGEVGVRFEVVGEEKGGVSCAKGHTDDDLGVGSKEDKNGEDDEGTNFASSISDASTASQDAAGIPAQPSSHDRSRSPSPLPAPAFPRVQSITFTTPVRTLSAPSISAYTALLTRIIALASQTPTAALRSQVESLHSPGNALDAAPLESLVQIARFLSMPEPSIQMWRDELSVYWDTGGEAEQVSSSHPLAPGQFFQERPCTQQGSSTAGTGADAAPPATYATVITAGVDDQAGPFAPLLNLLKKSEEEEREDMKLFVERYKRAGGWRVPGKRKVFALMMEEARRRKRVKRKDEDAEGEQEDGVERDELGGLKKFGDFGLGRRVE